MDNSAQVGFYLDLKAVQTNLVLFLQELLMKFCKNFLAVAVCLYFWGVLNCDDAVARLFFLP